MIMQCTNRLIDKSIRVNDHYYASMIYFQFIFQTYKKCLLFLLNETHRLSSNCFL